MHKAKIRAIAFYLPQFHPIPENNLWWGNGFTEWTNVTKAKPLFRNHYQPILPTELGLYDLRVPEVRQDQAQLAKEYGIEGFCYWHYWFGNGRRLLERPFNEVLETGKPDFPFCLGWANETWSGVWHGSPDKVLIRQEYPGSDDYIQHFEWLEKAFKDKRYITVNGRPLFLVYKPTIIPDLKQFVDIFRKEALKAGLPGLYLVGNNVPLDWNPSEHGFDASSPIGMGHVLNTSGILSRVKKKVKKYIRHPKIENVFDYSDAIKKLLIKEPVAYTYLPCVYPNWDNTARSGNRGVVFHNATPELFRQHLREGIELAKRNSGEEQIVFIKSWNEWAEGNYLEPDIRFGRGFLEVVKEEINNG